MALQDIRQPSDLRGLTTEQLQLLAGEIRDFIVSAVSETGGHLGSNLGAVELTMALHRVFESPTDAILWDTGHQAYVHKILTGRRGGFSQLRQAGGLSGYPSREESVHDFIENSHASTVLSYAHGLAVARDNGTAGFNSKVRSTADDHAAVVPGDAEDPALLLQEGGSGRHPQLSTVAGRLDGGGVQNAAAARNINTAVVIFAGDR